MSGTRMLSHGIKGMSKGITNEGAVAGDHLLDCAPLNLQMSIGIEPWIDLWWPTKVCGKLNSVHLKIGTEELWMVAVICGPLPRSGRCSSGRIGRVHS